MNNLSYKERIHSELECIADNCIINEEDMNIFELCADEIINIVEELENGKQCGNDTKAD